MKFLISLFICSALSCYSQATNDFNTWNALTFEKKIYKKTDLHFSTQTRLIENSTRYNFSFFDIGIDRKINKHFSYTGAYVFNIKRDLDNYLYFRHQLYGNINYEKKFGDFKISNRFRLQSDLDDQISLYKNPFSVFFYRNKTALKYDFTKKTSTYVAFEWYYKLINRNIDEPTIARTRTAVGLSYDFKKRKKLSVYYMLQQQQRNNFMQNTYVLGSEFTYRLKK